MTWNGEGRGLSESSLSMFFADFSPVNSSHTATMQDPVLGLFLSLPTHKLIHFHGSLQANVDSLVQSSLMLHTKSSLEQRNLKLYISKDDSHPAHITIANHQLDLLFQQIGKPGNQKFS